MLLLFPSQVNYRSAADEHSSKSCGPHNKLSLLVSQKHTKVKSFSVFPDQIDNFSGAIHLIEAQCSGLTKFLPRHNLVLFFVISKPNHK